MQLFHSRRQIIFAAVLLVLVAAGATRRLVTHGDSMAFLPARAGASWILDDTEPEASAHYASLRHTNFKRAFTLGAAPADASLSLCAFKSAAVTINGKEISGLEVDGKNWKSPATASVAGLLHAGTNEIIVVVTNCSGPPALWLHLEAGTFSLGSDKSWLASPLTSHWLNARMAGDPPEIPGWSQFNERQYPADSISHAGGELAWFTLLALALIFFTGRFLKNRGAITPDKLTGVLLAIVIIARAVLFIHDAPKLPHRTGFDAVDHEAYIQFIQQKKSLPLPNDGWEMHQPPLYYLVSAGWLDVGGFTAGKDNAVLPLRAVNGVIGLLHCWLALLCLRRLFPENISAQAAGLLIASFLPANLYLSMYVTNDPLAGLLVTLALYLFLRWEAKDGHAPRLACGIGLALGAAMLAKLSSLLAVPVFLAAMWLGLFLRGNHSPRDWFRNVGLMGLVCLLACGWHYGRVWMQIGALPLPNSQTDPSSAWWQEPGFRTAAYYAQFGRSLILPLFSGLDSFADGIYSTLWADGLISGCGQLVFRPPWNYDLMNAGCLIAAVVTLLAATGLVVTSRKLMWKPGPSSLLLVGMIFSFTAGIIMLTLHGPWLAHVKAFYALPALVPFSASVAAGLAWLAKKNRAGQTALWLILLVWTFTAYASFWIRGDNPEFWRSRAIVSLQKLDSAAAVANISNALQINPEDVESHCILAEALNQQGKTADALGQYAEALQLRPDSPAILKAVAEMLANGDKSAAVHASAFALRACELTHYRQADFISTLAAAQFKAGNIEAAIISAQTACELAAQNGNELLLQKNRALLELCRPLQPAR